MEVKNERGIERSPGSYCSDDYHRGHLRSKPGGFPAVGGKMVEFLCGVYAGGFIARIVSTRTSLWAWGLPLMLLDAVVWPISVWLKNG